jgi:hypothetical protein
MPGSRSEFMPSHLPQKSKHCERSVGAFRGSVLSRVSFAICLFVALPLRSFDKFIPSTCPIPRSTDIQAITITDLHRTYPGAADTWYPVWAGTGTGYSPFMDGMGANGNYAAKIPTRPKLGFAIIAGDDPMKLKVKKATVIEERADEKAGNLARYGCTVLPYHGVLYYGSSYRFLSKNMHYLRPFAGFDISTDGGASWTKRSGDLFPEAEYPDIKIGEPHFVDFGPELKNSPDGKAYLVAFGAKAELAAKRPKQTSTRDTPEDPQWNWGDCVYLARVTPTPATVNDASSYEFFAGNDAAGKPEWTHDFSKIKPVVEWPDHMGQVTMTYVPALKKYIMCVGDGGNYSGHYNTYFLESSAMTGPWRMVTYWGSFGTQAYFADIPSKFLGTTVENGSLKAWLVYSANFCGTQIADPPDSSYAMCLRQISIQVPADAAK